MGAAQQKIVYRDCEKNDFYFPHMANVIYLSENVCCDFMCHFRNIWMVIKKYFCS